MNFLIEILISFFWEDFEGSEHPYILAFAKGIFLGILMFMYYAFKFYFFNIDSAISIFELFGICMATGSIIGILSILIVYLFRNK